MLKSVFLADPDVRAFVDHLAELICGHKPINFSVEHPGGQVVTYSKLEDAFKSYSWPNHNIAIHVPGVPLPLTIPAHSSFAVNQAVLAQLESGIRAHIPHRYPGSGYGAPVGTLEDWAQAIMVWGGVYNGGNAAWLAGFTAGSFAVYLSSALAAVGGTNDTVPAAVRSNAGTTKIHSLALDNFIIYDSRVAGALAWLVHEWKGCGSVPALLRFRCLPAQAAANRLPCRRCFGGNHAATHPVHAMWNMRASWIIEAALAQAIGKCGRPKWLASAGPDSRKVEAALFMLGERLP